MVNTCRRGVVVVGAQVAITPSVRGAAPGAAGRSVLDVREGRGQPAVVAGVKVPAVSDGPEVLLVIAQRPVVVPAADFGRQQVIPDEILIQLGVVVFPVAAHLHFVGAGDAARGRLAPLKGALPRRDRDGHRFTCLAAEPAPLPGEGDHDAPRATRRLKLRDSRVRHPGSQPVALVVAPRRLINVGRPGERTFFGVKVLIFAVKDFRLVPLLPIDRGLEVNQLEFLLRHCLLESFQVAFAYLQLGLNVLHRFQVHLRHLSVGEFILPVLCEFLLLPHVDVLTWASDKPQSRERLKSRTKILAVFYVFAPSRLSTFLSFFPPRYEFLKPCNVLYVRYYLIVTIFSLVRVQTAGVCGE